MAQTSGGFWKRHFCGSATVQPTAKARPARRLGKPQRLCLGSIRFLLAVETSGLNLVCDPNCASLFRLLFDSIPRPVRLSLSQCCALAFLHLF